MSGNLTLTKGALDASSTKNEACIYVQWGVPTLDTDGYVTAFAPTGGHTTYAEANADQFLIGVAEAKEAKKIGQLPAATGTDPDEPVCGLGAFQFNGQCVSSPKTAWATTDKIDECVLTFTLKKGTAAAPAGGGS